MKLMPDIRHRCLPAGGVFVLTMVLNMCFQSRPLAGAAQKQTLSIWKRLCAVAFCTDASNPAVQQARHLRTCRTESAGLRRRTCRLGLTKLQS
jgi:hypothetical protein